MTKDMTTGSPVKLILFFSIPLLIGNIFQQFYSMVDTIIVGRFLGVKALAAVGSTGSMSFLILGFVLGLCSGFSVLISQKFGANDNEGLTKETTLLLVPSLDFKSSKVDKAKKYGIKIATVVDFMENTNNYIPNFNTKFS